MQAIHNSKLLINQHADASMNPEHKSYNPCKSRKTCTTASPKTSPVPKKQVHFAETSTLILTEPRSESDLLASWYTKRNFQHFRSNIQLSSRALEHARVSTSIKHVAYSIASGTPRSDISFRHQEDVCGIENFISPSLHKILLQKRRKTIASVLEEQDLQRRQGRKDSRRIALASMENSAFTREWRHRLACMHVSE